MKHYLVTGGIMNLRTLFVWSAVLSLTAFMACEEPTGVEVVIEPGEASVSGKVVREDNTPIADASVLLSTTLGSLSTASDASGQYSFIFVFDTIQDAVSAKVLVTKVGFSSDSTSFFLAPGNTITGLNFALAADTGAIQPPDTVGVEGPSGPASNIVVAALSRDNISVRGAGGAIENAKITFEARDADGIPVDLINTVTVSFSIQAGPGGGEFLFPVSATTDSVGRVSTTLNSGTVSGAVQVIAQATVGTTSLQSEPVMVVIHGGLPDQAHMFSSWADQSGNPMLSRLLNIPGDMDNQGVQVQVGDRYSNPVVTGTAVYFTSSLGIVTPQAATDDFGIGSAVLSVAGETRLGAGELISSTFGEGGVTVSDTLDFLVSGAPVIQLAGNPDGFLINENGFATFDYTVSDAVGNPLSGGATISVSMEGTGASLVSIEGDIDVTIPNTADAATWTNFSFRIFDPDLAPSSSSGTLVVTVSVTGPNGDEQTSFSGGFQGEAGPPPGGSGDAQSFVLASLSPTEISVRGVGGRETATIIFEARDNEGRPIDSDHAITADFLILSGPGGGEFIAPTSVLTDAAGRARATINSGTVSGPMQIQVQAFVPATGSTVTSTPVQLAIASGLPDQAHFSVATQRLNFWGWDRLNNRMSAVVLVGDKYSNPVKPGTVVSFRTDGNVVAGDNLADATGGSSLTDGSGIAVATIISGNPRPRIVGFVRDGYGYLKAQTLGEPVGGVPTVVRDSALYVTTSDVALLSVSPTTFTIPQGGVQAFTVTVEDVNGNPIAGGSTISMSTTYSPPDGSNIVILIEPPSIKIPDALFPGAGATVFQFQIVDATPGGTTFAQPFPVSVTATHVNTETELKFTFSGSVGG